MTHLLKPLLLLTLLFGTAAVSSAQYIRPADNSATPESYIPSSSSYLSEVQEFADNYAAINSDLAETLKKKGRNRLITGCALSLTGLAMYASAFTMVSDSTDIGSYFAIGGIAVFTSAIPFYISGASCCIKSRKAAIEAAPCKLAIVF